MSPPGSPTMSTQPDFPGGPCRSRRLFFVEHGQAPPCSTKSPDRVPLPRRRISPPPLWLQVTSLAPSGQSRSCGYNGSDPPFRSPRCARRCRTRGVPCSTWDRGRSRTTYPSGKGFRRRGRRRVGAVLTDRVFFVLLYSLGALFALIAATLLKRPAQMKQNPNRYFRPAVFICDEYQSFATVGEDDPSGDEKCVPETPGNYEHLPLRSQTIPARARRHPRRHGRLRTHDQRPPQRLG